MAIGFDAANRVILLDVFNVSASEIWSRWLDWIALSDNFKYLPAFSQIGGVAPIALYLTLKNGWLIRSQESDGTTVVTGNLSVDGGGSPFTDTIGNFKTRIELETPVAAQAILVNTGSGVIPQDITDIATAVWVNAVRELTSGGSGGGLTTTQNDQLFAIPTNPLLTTDIRLDLLDVAISSRSNHSITDVSTQVWQEATRSLTVAAGLTSAENTQLFAIPTSSSGGGSLTSDQNTQLFSLPTAEQTAKRVWDEDL